jgi:hypothetical protein
VLDQIRLYLGPVLGDVAPLDGVTQLHLNDVSGPGR